jgi:hypothetical protein
MKVIVDQSKNSGELRDTHFESVAFNSERSTFWVTLHAHASLAATTARPSVTHAASSLAHDELAAPPWDAFLVPLLG